MNSKTRSFFICFFFYQFTAILSIWPDNIYLQQVQYSLRFIWLGLFTALSTIMLFRVIKGLAEDAQLKADVALLEKQQKLKEQQIQAISKRHKETEALQAEMTAQLEKLYTDLKSGNHSAACEYFRQISGAFKEIQFRPCCSDTLLNAILESKRQKAEENHIRTEYQILLPADYNCSSAVLSCILFNLLDNGIEACMTCQAPDPFLYLSIKTKGDFLTIHLKNSKNPDIPFSRHTTKQDALAHGFGLSIIEETVEENDGSCEWLDKGDIFESIILMRRTL
ncbi:MAG: GHKL domain-containing protein [Eubacteriales bacterium]|nr:GHKL domain-containing protein [Eubacteriales bacterium]